MTKEHVVITISHQLGSGGAFLGQKLSERLGIPFLDREILKKVSNQLHMAESTLAGREERLSSFWESFSRLAVLGDPTQSVALPQYEPSDRELFQLESDTIRRIAERGSAILIGRCGRYILRDHPAHLAIFTHAEWEARVKRIGRLYSVPEEKAAKILEENDRERGLYIKIFAGEDWLDARLYDVCLNTTRLGYDACVDLVIMALRARGLNP